MNNQSKDPHKYAQHFDKGGVNRDPSTNGDKLYGNPYTQTIKQTHTNTFNYVTDLIWKQSNSGSKI
jgi:hypothetical protein